MVRVGIAGLVVLALLVVAPAWASAQGGDVPTRAEFVADADRICEVPYRKGLRLLGNGDQLADSGKYGRAGKKVQRAGRTFIDVNRRLAALVPPPADATLIEAWLNGAREGFDLVVDAGKALKDKRPQRADSLLDKANRATRRANKKVAALGFRFCA